MMKKNNIVYELIRYNLTILLLFIVSFYIHAQIMIKSELQVPYSMLSIYLFFAIAAGVVATTTTLLKKIFPDQIGYIFIMLGLLKLGAFLLIFSDDIFTDPPLNKLSKLLMLVPLFIFLIYESLLVIKQLKQLFK